MTQPGPDVYDIPTQQPPVDVRIETSVAKLAHNHALSYDEAAAIGAILRHDIDAANWHLRAEINKLALLNRRLS